MNNRRRHVDNFLVHKDDYYSHDTTYTDFDPPCHSKLKSDKDYDKLSNESRYDPEYIKWCESVLGYSLEQPKTRKRTIDEKKTR